MSNGGALAIILCRHESPFINTYVEDIRMPNTERTWPKLIELRKYSIFY
jgi:hypothetical protein